MRRRLMIVSGTGLLVSGTAWAQAWMDNQSPPIFDAVREGNLDEVRERLRVGENANQSDRRNVPLIVYIASRGHPGIMMEILKYRPIIDLADPQGNTALITAAREGNQYMVDMLAKQGAKIDAQNRQGVTALMEAAGGRHVAVVKALMPHKPEVNITDYTGRTALAHAREARSDDVAQILRSAGGR